MKASDTQFAGSIPALYDQHLGPVLFAPYAADLAERVARAAPKRVLEIAAGTGRLTSELVRRLPGASIVATDLNQPMIDYASKHVHGPIEWRQADAMALPFADGAFDAVVCQFGAMFFPDKPRAYAEARRVLRPGGRFWFNSWSGLEKNELAAVVTEVVTARFDPETTRFLACVPYAYADAAAIRRDLVAGGFTAPQIEPVVLTSPAESARSVAVGFCEGTPMRLELEARHPGRLAEATDVATAALEARWGTGPIAARMSALVIDAPA
jgi:SAM-dependent methyltransferase